MSGWFKPLRRKPIRYDVIAFDVEGCGGPGGFVCGAVVGECIHAFYTDPALMFGDLLSYGADGFLLFAHNLQYDLPVLEGETFPSGDLLFSRYSLLWGKYRKWGKEARFYDSGNLFPRHSVGVLGHMFDLPKLDIAPSIMERLASGAAWSQFLPDQQEAIRRYVFRDAEIVYQAVTQLQELLLELGGQLRPTVAGCAMDLYRRVYHRWPWRTVGPATNNLVRGAYYGGRVEAYYMGVVEGVNMYDVTSLYPYAQRETRYPLPSRLQLDLSPRPGGEWEKWEGVAQATVSVPDQFIPLLPHRFARRLFFPAGPLTGEWTLLELRYALDHGATLEAVGWVLGSPVTFNPFGEYVDRLFDLRQFYLSRGEGWSNLVKLLLNSLYGRWGINPEGGLYQLVNIDTDRSLDDLEGYVSMDINGSLYAYGPIKVTRPPDYANVLIASQISAQGRTILLDELLHQGEDAIYCDTDSIITRGQVQTGEGLGSWRCQMEAGSADLLGPKAYALHNQVTGSKYVAKGVPAKVAQAYLEQGAVRFLKALPIREAINMGKYPATWVETFRSNSQVVPKRFPVPGASQVPGGAVMTRPYQSSELVLVFSGSLGEFDLDPLDPERIHPQGLLPRQLVLDEIAPPQPRKG